jgi:hypothetical protein
MTPRLDLRNKVRRVVGGGYEVTRYVMWLSAGIAAAVLTGCGGQKNQGSGSGGRSGPDAVASKADLPANASAEQVAAEGRAGLDCPPDISTPPRATGGPVDDIQGVRFGMSFEEARAWVLCSDPLLVTSEDTSRGFRLPAEGKSVRQGFEATFAKARVERTGRQIAQDMQDEAMGRGLNRVNRNVGPGQSKWFVGTLGMPGEERVISVSREEWFPSGREPTVSAVAQALIAKYGPATRDEPGGDWHRLSWSYDAKGARVVDGSPLYARCRANPSPDSGLNFVEDCGLTIEAWTKALPDNPDLVQFLQVGIVDQARGYAALEATTQGLEKQAADRRAEQVKDASKNAATPNL